MQVEVQELQVTTALSSATSRFGLTVQGAPAKGNVAFPAGQTGQRKWLSFGLFLSLWDSRVENPDGLNLALSRLRA